MSFPNWKPLLQISAENWAVAVVVTLTSYLLLYGILRFLSARLGASAHKGSMVSDMITEVLLYTNRFIIFAIAVLIGLSTIELPPLLQSWLARGWVVVIGIQIALGFNRAINVWLRQYHARADIALRDRASTGMLVFLMRFVVWLTVVLAVLANLGVNITALVASLGIGGIAVALGLQTVLSDLFASLAIALDKPFSVGDFIIFGDTQGTVTHIGVKTTRIQSLSGEQVIISNTELLKQTVHNYQQMQQRRVVFGFSVTYDTPVEQLAELSQVVREIITAIDQTRFDRAHFKSFGESTLDYEVVYYVLSADYTLYMDIQQRINLELMQACAARHVEFGYPFRTVHLTADSAPAKQAFAAASSLMPFPLPSATPQQAS
jgi:small-conductance mechanosensitive channel